MKLAFTLVALSLFPLTQARAESCADNFQEGYSCVESAGQYLLREYSVSRDHNLDVCTEMTVENFGNDKAACEKAAAALNR